MVHLFIPYKDIKIRLLQLVFLGMVIELFLVHMTERLRFGIQKKVHLFTLFKDIKILLLQLVSHQMAKELFLVLETKH